MMKLIRKDSASHHRVIVAIVCAVSPFAGRLSRGFDNEEIGKP